MWSLEPVSEMLLANIIMKSAYSVMKRHVV
jgi:hypothetical protein